MNDCPLTPSGRRHQSGETLVVELEAKSDDVPAAAKSRHLLKGDAADVVTEVLRERGDDTEPASNARHGRQGH